MSAPRFPGTSPLDDCETPAAAFDSIAPLLRAIATAMGTKPRRLRIWDPFYCNGAAGRHLAALGFAAVHHVCDDFYSVLRERREPLHAVLVTNPPFSGDHIERLVRYATREGGSPAVLLLPAYVADKPWFRELVRGGGVGSSGETTVEGGWPAVIARRLPLGWFFIGPRDAPYSFAAPAEARSKTDQLLSRQKRKRSRDDVYDTSLSLDLDDFLRGGPRIHGASAQARSGEGVASASTTTTTSTSGVTTASAVATPSSSIEVSAGSFQCVWFVHLGSPNLEAAVLTAIQGSSISQIPDATAAMNGSGGIPRSGRGSAGSNIINFTSSPGTTVSVTQLSSAVTASSQRTSQKGLVSARGAAAPPLPSAARPLTPLYAVISAPGSTLSRDIRSLPQLTLVKKPTPAERRWRKKQQQQHATVGAAAYITTASAPRASQ